ncbi:SDR family oxidoreductase [Paractinoplanes atraurantiacus]|uniref:NAD(P)H dehydrogenase (Quinone) n=1 Tax=Paractinoplanes atraurantiacus TaxID=1036182 RepID=A0A285HUS9_9ACTN|nr:SDR family oxidoreductase [Actinoplanes atraurantiacus]SNY38471.1 NAD(P)H dehydrogenase (quinone) [Actinoplanes atraurantiacus]
MTFAITGASGGLGRLTIEELLAAGTPADQIVAIVRDPAKVTDLAERGVVVRQGDYSDRAAWPAALEGVDRLLLISVSGPGASTSHSSVIDAAVQVGVGHIAYTSIVNADHSSHPLAPEHFKTEQLIAASGIPFTILRNAWYHEVYTYLLPGYLETGEVVAATGDGRISGAARADFAAVTAKVLLSEDTGSKTYELGGPSFTLAELAQVISEVTGRTIVHRDVTAEELTARLTAAGAHPMLIEFGAAGDTSIRKGEMYTDSDAFARLLGRTPKPLAESIRAAL